jgi:hypothetical protein
MRVIPLSIEELLKSAAGGCQAVGCDHKHHGAMYMRARCHPAHGTFTSVDPRTKILRVECAVCKMPVVEVRLQPETPS